MRWFKHLTDAGVDPKLVKIKAKFGMWGIGSYWTILEKIGREVNKEDRTWVEYRELDWAHLLGTSRGKLRQFLEKCAETSPEHSETQPLLSVDYFVAEGDQFIRVGCPKLLKYRDEYTRKKSPVSGQYPERVRSLSGETPEEDTETDTDTEKEKKALKVRLRDGTLIDLRKGEE